MNDKIAVESFYYKNILWDIVCVCARACAHACMRVCVDTHVCLQTIIYTYMVELVQLCYMSDKVIYGSKMVAHLPSESFFRSSIHTISYTVQKLVYE